MESQKPTPDFDEIKEIAKKTGDKSLLADAKRREKTKTVLKDE